MSEVSGDKGSQLEETVALGVTQEGLTCQWSLAFWPGVSGSFPGSAVADDPLSGLGALLAPGSWTRAQVLRPPGKARWDPPFLFPAGGSGVPCLLWPLPHQHQLWCPLSLGFL